MEQLTMPNQSLTYGHLIEIDSEKRTLFIYRMFSDGREKQLYTSVQLPQELILQDRGAFDRFAKTLGENILIDLPQARDALGI